jgi:hypothetical protein
LVAVSVSPRPRCVHIRRLPGRFEGVCGVATEAFVEVPVDIEDGLDARVSDAGGDDGGVGAFGDEEGNVAAAEVMEPHGLADGVCDGGEPDAAAEGAAAPTSFAA